MRGRPPDFRPELPPRLHRRLAGKRPGLSILLDLQKGKRMNDLNLLKTEPYRFNPMSCRSANISTTEAYFLRWLFLAERSNAEIIQEYGMGLAYGLLKQGYVENPLGERDNANTNLWKLTPDGTSLLKRAAGVNP
jgi:hypothetical protein